MRRKGYRNGWLLLVLALFWWPALAGSAHSQAWPDNTEAWAALQAFAVEPRDTPSARERAADRLVEMAAQVGLLAEKRAYAQQNEAAILDLIFSPYRGHNVLIEIPATSGAQDYIILGAHYDSVLNSPGADDNGSGVATLLSLAVEISQLEVRNYPVLIAFFDQEEEGLRGSRALVRQLMRAQTPIHSMHNLDMVAWDGDGDRVFEVEAGSDEWQNRYRLSADVVGVELDWVEYNSTDHVAFRRAGIVSNCVSEAFRRRDGSPYYHSPDDEVSRLDPATITRVQDLMSHLLISVLTESVVED